MEAVTAERLRQSSAELAEGGVGWRSGRAFGVLAELGRRSAELERARSAVAQSLLAEEDD